MSLRERWSRVRSDPHPMRRLSGGVLVRTGLHRWVRLRRPGYRLHFDRSSVCRRIWRDPQFGLADEAVLSALVKPGDRVVDIGANVGTTAIALALAVGNEGRVEAVEAHPRTARRLQRNVALNRLTQVRVHQAAIANDTRTVRLSDEDSDDLNHVIDAGGVLVKAQPLSVFLDRPTALLKVDVEGLEYDVLRSAGNSLAQVHAVYFEYVAAGYQRYGRELSDVVDLLSRHELTTYRLDAEGLTPLPDDYTSSQIENLIALRSPQ